MITRTTILLAFVLSSTACSVGADSPDKIANEPQSNAEVSTEAENAFPSESSGIEPKPVRVGFDGPEFDACASYGEVSGLKPDGDNFLSVRNAPSIAAEEVDRLGAGAGLSMCDYSDGWIGVVYSDQGDADCGTGSPVAEEQDYDGPCKSGWVSDKFVTLLAG